MSITRSRSYSRRSFSVPSLAIEAGSVKVTATSLDTIADATGHHSSKAKSSTLLSKFVTSQKELDTYKKGTSVTVDGQTISIAAVTAASRYHATVELTSSSKAKDLVNKSRKIMGDKVDAGLSIYGVSTGFGGSADARTDQPLLLGHSLLQMQHIGVLPSSTKAPETLPLLDPSSLSMPESWVRGAILLRMNSLCRGHSGVRWELIERMRTLLDENIIPLVPMRGSISASGDLSPLSYIAGTLCGNPSIRVYDGSAGSRQIVSACDALKAHNIDPLPLASKEPLGILNGTSFSASVAALVLNDAVHLALLTQVCTALGVEALAGTRASFDPFIHVIARPHPGQVESAKIIWDLLEGSQFTAVHVDDVKITEDKGQIAQDRYPLRTAPQFIGPQLEDLLSSLATITQECNSTTDNPLVDAETGRIHYGGNFQAMAVTNVMEKTRLSLHHFGKLLFTQCAELMDPNMNRGLPPNLAATDPSLNYHGKGIDIATAAYVAELGYLANPVSTHIQSAEMNNQAVNSLALLSGRQTATSIDVLSILISSYLYALCQALDLRTMHKELVDGVNTIASEELASLFGASLTQRQLANLSATICSTLVDAVEHTTTMDAADRMQKVAASTSTCLVDFFTSQTSLSSEVTASALISIPTFRAKVASRSTTLLDHLQRAYLSGERGRAPASRHLNKTRPVYEFVRLTLGIRMHGSENYQLFPHGHGVDEQTTGQNISLIYEAIRDGRLQSVILSMFSS